MSKITAKGTSKYGVTKTSVSFRYQLNRLYHMLNWSASHKYQLVHHYNVSNWSVFPVRRRKKVSNWSVLLTYQLRSHEDVSVWSRTFKLVSKMGKFILGTRHYIFYRFGWFSLIKVPVRTSLQRFKDRGHI